MQLQLTRSTIRSWRPDDAAAIAEGANNRNIWLCVSDKLPFPYTLADAEAYLQKTFEADVEHSFCIEVNGKTAGGIGIHPGVDIYRVSAEIGYWLAEPYWGRGIMSEAVRAFVAERFAAFPLERIFAQVYARNRGSARVLEKAGFEFEARLRRNVIKDGQVLDSLMYSKLRDS